MGEPALQLPDDITPDIPELRVVDGEGEGDGVPQGNLSSVSNDDAPTPETEEANALSRKAGGEPFDFKDQLGKGFTSLSSEKGLKGALGKSGVRFFRLNRKQKIGGGAAAGGVTIAVLVALTVGGGPFELLHLSQLLHGAHFAQQEDAGDTRVGRLFRYVSRGGRVGETRLNFLESKYHAKIIGELKGIGIVPEYAAGDIFKGFAIDLESPGSPYKDLTPQQAADALEKKTGIKPTIDGNKLTVDADKFFTQRRALKSVLGELNSRAVATQVRVRVLGKFGFVTWKPIGAVDKSITKKGFAAWEKARQERINKAASKNLVDLTRAQEDTGEKDAKGNPRAPVDISEPSVNPATESSKSTLKNLAGNKGVRATGGVAAGVGLVCLAKAVDDKVEIVRYEQAIIPLMTLGMEQMAAGYQVAGSGIAPPGSSPISLDEVGYWVKLLHQNDEDGKPSNWNESDSFQAPQGQTGTAMDPEVRQTLTQAKPAWLDWTQKAPVTQICSTTGQVIVGGISVAIGVISGGVVSTATQVVAGLYLVPKLIDRLAELLSGESINIAKGGAQYGTFADWGVKYGSDAAALANGAVGLSPKEAAEVNQSVFLEQQQEFGSKSLFAKVFDIHDYRSVASKAVDNTPKSANVASFMNIMSSGLANLIRIPATIFSPKVGAAPRAVDYGSPQYGFSQEDLNNPLVANPYENADAVAGILNNNPDYVKKVESCFGVKLSKGGNGWEATPEKSINVYSSEYDATGCTGKGNNDWLRIRFFIFDSAMMEGYACYKFDDQDSCKNSGFGGGGNSTTTQTAGGQIVGDIGESSDTIDCADNTKDLGVVTSQYAGAAKKGTGDLKIRLCQLSSIDGQGDDTSGTRLHEGAVVNARVSGALQAMGEKAKSQGVPLTANSSFRLGNSCGGNGDGRRCASNNGSMHQLGVAIDFAGPTAINPDAQTCAPGVRQQNPGNPTWDWLEQNAAAFGYRQYSAEAWHWDPLNTANRCGGDGS